MWRFILLTFAFLALAFYELSGGADYAPRENSLQVAWAKDPLFARPRPVPPRPRDVAMTDTDTDLVPRLAQHKRRAVQAARDAREARKEARYRAAQEASRFKVTLANASTARSVFDPEPIKQMGLSGVGAFSAGTLAHDVSADGRTGDADLFQSADTSPSRPADIRAVTGTLVNMRGGPGTDYAPVDQLSQGMQVEVLETADNGWVRLRALDTGQTGWMADWFVTAEAQ